MDGEVSSFKKLSLDEAMQLAIQEAYKGAPHVSPNPKVGCVILDREGALLSKGFHQRYGGSHAEVEALKSLKDEQLKGAHVIVTLEPCAHQGQTPSCAKKLATLPIAQVTYGIVDPNPLVSGQGHKILEAAGIATQEYQGVLKQQLEEVCEEFLVNFREKRIFVAMKVAQSLDGKVALKNGQSQWITGPESRQKVQQIRAGYDAVMVGMNTVLKDNPSLNIRLQGVEKENTAVVLGSQDQVHKIPKDFNIFKVRKSEKVLFYEGELKPILDSLFEKGIRSLLVEGGAHTFSQFLEQNLVDRLHLFTAPKIIGEGLGWTDHLRFNSMDQVGSFRKTIEQSFGPDQYLSFQLK